MDNKFKVEIWSDVACPFCYIGKREFEKALETFPEKDNLDIEWKSYQLDPDLVTNPKKSFAAHLSEAKGISVETAEHMGDQIAERARGLGLDYHFEKVIPANTMKAHNLIHFAKKYNKQNEAEEILFRAYFIEGKNIDDIKTLLEMGDILKLHVAELKTALEDLKYYDDVRADIYEAFQLGVRGVPFFVFDRKYAVSGAQQDEAFRQTLKKSYSEWEWEQNKPLIVQDGEVCDIEGKCH